MPDGRAGRPGLSGYRTR